MWKHRDKIEILAFVMAVVAIGGLAFPYVNRTVSAVDESVTVTATIRSIITLDYEPSDPGVDDPAAILTAPTESVGTGSAILTAESNNPTGYSVNIKMNNDDKDLNYLVSSQYTEYTNGGTVLDTSKNVFAPTAPGVATLTENTWGYYMGTPEPVAWNPVPVASGTPATLFGASSYGTSSAVITFGARQGFYGLNPNTTYSNTVLFTATNNV